MEEGPGETGVRGQVSSPHLWSKGKHLQPQQHCHLLLSPIPHPLEWAQIPALEQLQELVNPNGMWAGEPGTKNLGYWEIIKPQGTGKVPRLAAPILSLGRLNKDPSTHNLR